mmetsp:Transcript_13491/g.35458  ORF Transcript_13491/g.35458 Transcript_13491/m.35458 type:complete len:812 (-) Transcript_13491:165-2600(-)
MRTKIIQDLCFKKEVSKLQRLPTVKLIHSVGVSRQRRQGITSYRKAEGQLAKGNYAKAFIECMRASSFSHPQAMELRYLILSKFDSSEERDESLGREVGKILKAAEKPKSPHELWIAAVCLSQGWGVRKNAKLAGTYLRRASRHNHAASYLMLGYIHQHGSEHRERNAVDAMKAYRKGAQLGSVACLNNVGTMLRDGDGIDKDEELAQEYFQEAARLGYALARANVAKIVLERCKERRRNERERQLERDERAGSSEGKSKERERERSGAISARERRRKSSLGEGGDEAIAQMRGLSFRGLVGRDRKDSVPGVVCGDESVAFALANQAANAGNAFGMSVLGQCFLEGIGAPKDAFEAGVWLYRAKLLAQFGGRRDWLVDVNAMISEVESAQSNVMEWREKVEARIRSDVEEEERERLAKATGLDTADGGSRASLEEGGSQKEHRTSASSSTSSSSALYNKHGAGATGKREGMKGKDRRGKKGKDSSELLPGSYVFLSHKSDEKSLVRRLAAELKKNRIPVWIDEEQIKPGKGEWDTQIAEGIVNAGAAIFCLSDAFFLSSPCVTELKMMRRRVDKGEIGEDCMVPVVIGVWDEQVPLRCLFALSGDTLQRCNLAAISGKGQDREWKSQIRQLAERIRPMLSSVEDGVPQEGEGFEAEEEVPVADDSGEVAKGKQGRGEEGDGNKNEELTLHQRLTRSHILRWIAGCDEGMYEQLLARVSDMPDREFKAVLSDALAIESEEGESDEESDEGEVTSGDEHVQLNPTSDGSTITSEEKGGDASTAAILQQLEAMEDRHAAERRAIFSQLRHPQAM